MKLWLVKDLQGKFVPYNEPDYEKAKKIPEGEDNLFEIKRIRNPRHHRKYFAMINLAFQNQEQYDDLEKFRKLMQMKAGYYEPVVTDKGTTYWPTSIAFDKLDQTEFNELYNKVWAVLEKEYGFDNETFEQELINFM